MLLGSIERALATYGTHRRGADVVLVACSGGVDSIALAFASVELLGTRRVVLGHVDHGVRPDSAADAEFVRNFAAKLGVACIVDHASTSRSDEAHLRQLRYAFLEHQRDRAHARWILTAHTRDDQAETVLMRVLRSARVEGLRGIRERRGVILRPMLDVPRKAALAFAARHRLTWREDPTNLDLGYLRNRIRHELLPLLESRYRRGVATRLAALSRSIEPGPDATPSFEPQDTRRAGNAIAPACVAEEPPILGISIARPSTWEGRAPDGRQAAVFDAEFVALPVVRPARSCDRIQPFGMRGHKKVFDLLHDRGISRARAASTLVVAERDGTVLWIPGVARSAIAPIGSATRDVWVFSVEHDVLQAEDERVTLDSVRGVAVASEPSRKKS